MSIQFNLLPWREAERQKKAKVIKLILIGSAVAGLIASGAFYAWESLRLDDHKKAFAHIDAKNKIIKKKLAEKNKLDKLKITLNAQIDAMEDLQANRSSVSHIVEELSLANDQELYLEEFTLVEGSALLKGTAENDLAISDFMTALKKSSWYQEPELVSIVKLDGVGDEVKKFTVLSRILVPGKKIDFVK